MGFEIWKSVRACGKELRLDFIINYGIKYRMGKDNEEDNNGD